MDQSADKGISQSPGLSEEPKSVSTSSSPLTNSPPSLIKEEER